MKVKAFLNIFLDKILFSFLFVSFCSNITPWFFRKGTPDDLLTQADRLLAEPKSPSIESLATKSSTNLTTFPIFYLKTATRIKLFRSAHEPK